MSLSPAIAIITALLLILQLQVLPTRYEMTVDAESDMTARNMLVYRQAVTAYLAANPTATGTVADASLALPSWYVKTAGITNLIDAGIPYVFTTTPPRGLPNRLMNITNNSATVGTKIGGILINPYSTTNISLPIAVPSSIPDSAVVIVG